MARISFWDAVHQLLDHLLGICKLVTSVPVVRAGRPSLEWYTKTLQLQNREVGWRMIDRRTGRLMREQQPLWWKIKLLLLFNPLTEWINNTQARRLRLRKKTLDFGIDERAPLSSTKIREFIDFYHINMDDFEPSNIDAYPTFEDFFVRKHKPGTRPIHEKDDPSQAVIAADSRVVVYKSVAMAHTIWIKGKHFTIANLVMEPVLAKKWADGAVASFRLCPQDYHRFHSPVAGVVRWWKHIPGEYYNVDPIALRSGVDIVSKNARTCLCVSSNEFGDVLFVAIGATGVGTIRFHEKICKEGSRVEKGEEIGWFEFGGSSILVVFEPGRILFDRDLVEASEQATTVSVDVGMRMGVAVA
ncbi:Phosphatidylserine decarboxylase [Fusarium keratoplasticum]|nr:Phosphatidylserine decarboxylase [Fusarium keratoplasticum]